MIRERKLLSVIYKGRTAQENINLKIMFRDPLSTVNPVLAVGFLKLKRNTNKKCGHYRKSHKEQSN